MKTMVATLALILFPIITQSKVIELTSPEQVKVELAKPKPIVLVYGAEWCPACRVFRPIYEKLSEKMGYIRFYHMEVDRIMLKEHKGMATYIPTGFVGKNENQLRNNPCRILNEKRSFELVKEEIEECLRNL